MKEQTGPGPYPATLAASIDVVKAPWQDSPYYDRAEEWLHVFWDDGSLFRSLFDRLDLTRTVELAVGHGRHAAIVAPRAGTLIVMDVFEENLAFCRTRLSSHDNVRFARTSGAMFDGVDAGWATAIYCYDAMVHFSHDIVESYLNDTFRVLQPGGRALYHHSNFDSDMTQHYGLNPGARNLMTQEEFAALATAAGLDVLESTVIDWGPDSGIDCVTLVERPPTSTGSTDPQSPQ